MVRNGGMQHNVFLRELIQLWSPLGVTHLTQWDMVPHSKDDAWTPNTVNIIKTAQTSLNLISLARSLISCAGLKFSGSSSSCSAKA